MTPQEINDFWERVSNYHQQDHRTGQAMMNALYDVAPELYADVSMSRDKDCFYRDENIPAFREYLGI